MIKTAGDIAIPTRPVEPDMTCADLFDRLLEETGLMHVPVVVEGRPVGLISRQDFIPVYATLYGRDLYGSRPISLFMEENPLIVESGIDCDRLNNLLIDAGTVSGQQGFLVTDRGRYLGTADAVSLLRVVSELTRARAEELDRARQRAEAANAAKTSFLASMSHELRTPLNAIIGFADLIHQEQLGPVAQPAYKEFAEDIYRSGKHLLGLINDLLDMAKIEAGRHEIDESEFDPDDLIADVARMMRKVAADADVAFTSQICLTDVSLRADQRQISRVLINLVSNAIKFTPEGGEVCVCARRTADGGLSIIVKDSGIGIAPDKIDKVLEPFEQVENSFARPQQGTGLGLSITKAILEAHGGSLTLLSGLGEGTEAIATLPPARVIERVSENSSNAGGYAAASRSMSA